MFETTHINQLLTTKDPDKFSESELQQLSPMKNVGKLLIYQFSLFDSTASMRCLYSSATLRLTIGVS